MIAFNQLKNESASNIAFKSRVSVIIKKTALSTEAIKPLNICHNHNEWHMQYIILNMYVHNTYYLQVCFTCNDFIQALSLLKCLSCCLSFQFLPGNKLFYFLPLSLSLQLILFLYELPKSMQHYMCI